MDKPECKNGCLQAEIQYFAWQFLSCLCGSELTDENRTRSVPKTWYQLCFFLKIALLIRRYGCISIAAIFNNITYVTKFCHYDRGIIKVTETILLFMDTVINSSLAKPLNFQITKAFEGIG